MKKYFIPISSALFLILWLISQKNEQESQVTKNSTESSARKVKVKLNPSSVQLQDQLVHSTLAFVLGADKENTNLIARNRMILRMDPQDDYVDSDLLALIEFIAEPAPGEGSQLAYHSLKNDTLSFLIETGRHQELLNDKMLSVMEDRETHQVWREYIAQYLPDFYVKLDQSLIGNAQEKIMASLKAMTSEPVGALAGTSLMSLQRIQQETGAITAQEVIELSQRNLNDFNMESAAKMGALAVLTEYQDYNSYEIIEKILMDDNESVTLRMAAINAAYRLQDNHQIWLQDLENNLDLQQSDKRLLMVINNLKKQ